MRMPGLALVAAVLVASISAMTWAAAHVMKLPAMIAAAAAALALILLAANTNAAARLASQHVEARQAASTNAILMALVYGWGGLAMLAVYMLSGLYWRHGWQYGLGMLLIALGLYVYGRTITAPSSPLASPTAQTASAMLVLAQAIAAAIALIILIASGKLATLKGDWAANHIFVAGGISIIAISVLAYATHRRLHR